MALELPLPGRGRRARRTATPTLITPENPFGMDPDDPKGRDDVLVATPELHLPSTGR